MRIFTRSTSSARRPSRSGRRFCMLVPLCLLGCLAFAGSAAAKPSEQPFEMSRVASISRTSIERRRRAHEDLTTSFDFAHEHRRADRQRCPHDRRQLARRVYRQQHGGPDVHRAQLSRRRAPSSNLPQCPLASQVGRSASKSPTIRPARRRRISPCPLYNMEVTSFGSPSSSASRARASSRSCQVSVRPGRLGPDRHHPEHRQDPNRTTSRSPSGASPPPRTRRPAWRGLRRDFESRLSAARNSAAPKKPHIPVKPFLSNPTSCEPHTAIDAKPTPGSTRRILQGSETEVGPIGECERVPFDPSIEVQPTTRSAESPSGLNVSLVVPQTWENPYSIATANLKDTTVALPVGYTANPSLAVGSRGLHRRAVRSGNVLLAARCGLPGGIEDRDRRSRNAGARGKAHGQHLHRHAIREQVRLAARRCTSS